VERSPTLEPIDGDAGSVLATFSWRGEGDRVAVVGGVGGWEPSANLMERAADGTWRRSYVVPRAVRTTYGFLADPPDELQWGADLWYAIEHDPLNPATFAFPGDPEDPGFERDAVRSLLEGPDAPSLAVAVERPGAQRGAVRLARFRSELLGNERRVWLYTPPAHDQAAGPYSLLVVFDGWAYVNLVPAPTILDNLVADGAIPPLVAVLIDSLDGDARMRELCCDDAFVAFLADELLPWARAETTASDDPRRTIAAGSSAGGLAAAFAAYRRPDVVGNVLSQSGAFWWGRDGEGEWLTNRLAEAGRLPVRFWLDAGVLESAPPAHQPGAPSILDANRRLRDVLLAAGHEVHHAEFCGGHDYVCWRGTLADGLRALAPETT
jgi:enterochelin esterase-like enzyme